MGVRSQGNPGQCVSSQHFPPHPTLNLSLQAPGFLFPPPGSAPVQAQAFWMCALLHSWSPLLSLYLLFLFLSHYPSLSLLSWSSHSTGQAQSGSLQMPLAICSLPHICGKCPQPYRPKSSHVHMFSFIWCQNHRVGIYECLSKGLGCFP